MKLELNLDTIRQLSEEREEENFHFRKFLKGQDDEEVDEIVHRLHDEIVAQIDCTQCGNCCHSLKPEVTDKEIERLAKIDNLSPGEYVEKFVGRDELNATPFLKDTPCKYLKDKKCSIYPSRPQECRDYPYTGKDGFIFRLIYMIDNYGVCPIVFNLYERLKEEMGYRY